MYSKQRLQGHVITLKRYKQFVGTSWGSEQRLLRIIYLLSVTSCCLIFSGNQRLIKGKNVYFHSVVQFELIWTSIWHGWLDFNAMLGCNHVSSSEMPAKCLNKIFAILLYRPISKPEFPPRKGIVLNFSVCISLSLKIIRLLKNWLFVHDQKLSEGAF